MNCTQQYATRPTPHPGLRIPGPTDDAHLRMAGPITNNPRPPLDSPPRMHDSPPNPRQERSPNDAPPRDLLERGGGRGSSPPPPPCRNIPNPQGTEKLFENEQLSTWKCHVVGCKQRKFIIECLFRVPKSHQYTTTTTKREIHHLMPNNSDHGGGGGGGVLTFVCDSPPVEVGRSPPPGGGGGGDSPLTS